MSLSKASFPTGYGKEHMAQVAIFGSTAVLDIVLSSVLKATTGKSLVQLSVALSTK